MKTTDFIKESIGADADAMHQDHEVQLARQDCYNAAKDAIALHKMLAAASEEQGLEGWISEKLTLAADYLKTVKDHFEYDQLTQSQSLLPEFTFEAAEEQFQQGVAEGSNDTVAKHNAAVAKLPGGQAHRSNHPDLLKSAPKGYSFSVSHKLVPDKQTVSEMTSGGTGAGAFATGPAGGAGKPGTGVPKKNGYVMKRVAPKVGKGIY